MEKGDCCVQCEQITTLNKSDFDNATYVGHMNEGIMQKIEIALANQLGVSVQVPSLEELENIIEKIANSKAESIKNESIKVTDNYVISVIDKLQKAFNITDEAIKIEDTNIKSIIKNARKKWTREEMEIFIQDSEQMSTEDMSKKYNMSIKTVYSTKYRFRNTLNNMEVAN
jgi:uncharacterized radical SAM superfamily Fe-S cluster-containing enzyme